MNDKLMATSVTMKLRLEENTTVPANQTLYRDKRVLFTVPPTYPAVADYGAILTSHVHRRRVNRFLSASYPIPSWGLYWIKENCPSIEILDMPKWSDLERELSKGVDILGIGFYTYQVPDVIRLVELARKYGVKEIWGATTGRRRLASRSTSTASLEAMGKRKSTAFCTERNLKKSSIQRLCKLGG